MTQSIADVLDRAADLVAEGWTQGGFKQGNCYCLLGALAEAAGVDPYRGWQGHLADVAREPLAEVIGCSTFQLPDWNDAPGRTQAEVVAKLREAASKAREAQS